jgi:hypothetical protein
MSIKFLYLPSEGLQGEDIPSHAIWDSIKVASIRISLPSPLKIKAVYNSESWEAVDNSLIIQKVEWDGYLGLVFESKKTSKVADPVSVEYAFHLSNGEVVKKTKQINLFRPQLKIDSAKKIIIDPVTGYIKNRISVKNIGRGTLLIWLSSMENSPTKLETPPKYREFVERYISDLHDEMFNLAKEFPQFRPLIEEMLTWETRDWTELSSEELNRVQDNINRLVKVFANNADFLRGFAEAYAKALLKNTELIESIGMFVKFYESLVSKNVLLINPFDLISLTEKGGEIILKISQTDKLFDEYEDITLPKIELVCSKAYEVPIHRLFKWG